MTSRETKSLLGRSSTTSSSSTSVRHHRNSFDSDDDLDEVSAALLSRSSKRLLTAASSARMGLNAQMQKRASLCGRLRAYCNFKEGSVAIFLVLSILLLLFLTIIGGLLLRPFFTIGLLMAFGAALVFVLTEASSYGAWHHNREAENRFWIVVAVILSSTVIFAPDSPLSALGSTFPVLGVILVLVSAGVVHYYDRKLEREELRRAPHLRRVSSFILTNQESTKQKLQVVADALAALDYRFVAAKAINSTQILEAERDVLNVLMSCEKEELNYIVTNLNLALLFYKIKDQDILTFNRKEMQNRTKVLELLSRERLQELNVQARVAVLDALMNMRLKAHTSAEKWVRDIILGTAGRMLTRMKNACDLKGRVHNFHKLIYKDITSLEIREEIIEHLKREAEVVKNDGLLPKDRRKILSDVDDTLFSSGGSFPAGIDTSFPHHVLYPGVTSFYRELDLGKSSSTGEWEDGRQGNLVFLSARPHVYKDKCFSPQTQLLCADGSPIAAEDVIIGMQLLNSQGKPVEVEMVDRGYNLEVIPADPQQHVPEYRIRSVHAANEATCFPAKTMYEFHLAHCLDESDAVSQQPLVVTFDHIVLLMCQQPFTFHIRSLPYETKGFVEICHYKYRPQGSTFTRMNEKDQVWDLSDAPYKIVTSTPIEVPSDILSLSLGPTRDRALKPYYDMALIWAQRSTSLESKPELATCQPTLIWQPTAEQYYHFLQRQHEVANSPSSSDVDRLEAYAELCAWTFYNPSATSMRTADQVRPLQFICSSPVPFEQLCNDALGDSISPSQVAWLVGFYQAATELPSGELLRQVDPGFAHTVSKLNQSDSNWFSSLLLGLGNNSLSRCIPATIKTGSVQVRQHWLAGMVDAVAQLEVSQHSASYVLSFFGTQTRLVEDMMHVSRGLGFATIEIASTTDAISLRLLGVPADPRLKQEKGVRASTHLPVAIASKRMPQPHNTLSFAWSCVPQLDFSVKNVDFSLVNTRVKALPPTIEYVGITVEGGQILTREGIVAHNSEKKSYKKFEELRLMKTMGLHCVPTLLSGSLDSGFHMFRGLYEPMSAKKFNNFREYATLYPEFKFAFIGDNGQGDARAGEMMKELLQDQVEAVFVHQVQPIYRTPGYVNYSSLERYDKLGIYFFNTYVGAALQAAKLQMIHPQGLRRIMLDVVIYFMELKSSLGLPFHVWDARRCELNRDMEDANEYLKQKKYETVPMIPADELFPVGSGVETHFGVGIVEKFNAISGIYQVRLTDWVLTTGSVRAFIHGSDLMWHTKGNIGDAVSTKFGTGILTEIREQNGVHVVKLTEWSAAGSLAPLMPSPQGASSEKVQHPGAVSSTPYAYLQPDQFNIIAAAVGDQVQTMFGPAVVCQYRAPYIPTPALVTEAAVIAVSSSSSCTNSYPTNVGIYVCRLNWHDGGGAISYLNSRSIRKVREPTPKRGCVIQ